MSSACQAECLVIPSLVARLSCNELSRDEVSRDEVSRNN